MKWTFWKQTAKTPDHDLPQVRQTIEDHERRLMELEELAGISGGQSEYYGPIDRRVNPRTH